MKSFCVIYLSLKDGTVMFSQPYNSFTKAKENIDNFISSFAEKQGKKMVSLSKEQLEKIKQNKTPDDAIFVRKKISEATLYYRLTYPGRFYDTYSVEKLGMLGINEFSIASNFQDNSEEIKEIVEREMKSETVEKMSHGIHGNLILELKKAVLKRQGLNKTVEIKKHEDVISPQSVFISSLVERKDTLKHVPAPLTPPVSRLFDIVEVNSDAENVVNTENVEKTVINNEVNIEQNTENVEVNTENNEN